MRVLLFRWLCDTGGVSTSMLLLHRELTRRGVECEFWFCKPSNRLAEFQAAGRTTVAPVAQLAPRLARGDFDIVQMSASDPGAELIARLASGARVIVTGRGALADGWNRGNCFAYTAISRAMAQVCQPYTDLEVEVIRNAVDGDRLVPPASRGSGPPIVAFVGRTTAIEKDFPRFTRIAALLALRGARVWVADPHEAGWDRFDGLAIERVAVERWERVPHEQMPDFYRAIAVSGGAVFMTSRTEGFGNVAAEAAASGAMTVATDLLGLQESVIPGRTGVLFPPDATDEEVADLAWQAMATQPSPQACADAARVFSPAVMADAYLALYQRPEQRLVKMPVPATPGPGMDILLDHLGRQRRWRADVCISAAGGFSATGEHALALMALRLAGRAAPARLFGSAGLKEMTLLALRIIHRPARVVHQLRRARLAAPPSRGPVRLTP